MTATAAHTADLFGLTLGHARRLGREGERRVGLVAKLAHVLRFALHPVAFFSSFLDRLAVRMADQAVWFRGVAAQVDGGAPLEESGGVTKADLIAELEHAQDVLVSTRRSLLKLQAELSAQSRVRPSMERLLAAIADAYDAVEAARWAVMEREADEDITAGRVGPTYTSAAAFMASLNAG